MRFVRTLVCVSSLAFGSVAYAQDPQTPPPEGTPAPAPAPAAAPAVAAGSGYMGPELNRTLTMPQGGIEGELGLIISHPSAGDTGISLALGGRYGIMPNLNAGLMLSFALAPSADFSTFLVNAEYEFLSNGMMMAAGRVDLGATKIGGGAGGSVTAFDFGLGLPFKYVITPMIAFISGSQYAFSPFGIGVGSDILFFEFASGGTVTNLNIPVGLLFQFTPMVAAEFGTGFSLVHSGDVNLKFVPINLTLEANLNMGGVGLDPYFTFSIPGPTEGGYADTLVFIIGARLHL
jgi:hypothetical protein